MSWARPPPRVESKDRPFDSISSAVNHSSTTHDPAYELRFDDLFVAGLCYAFPCDARGRVDMDALSERARNNYLYARAVLGRVTALPTVRRIC